MFTNRFILPRLCQSVRSKLASLFLFAVFLLAACTPDPSPTAGTPRPTTLSTPDSRQTPIRKPTATATIQPTPTPSVLPEQLRGLSIDFWHPWPPEQTSILVEQFNRTNPWGFRVNQRAFSDDSDIENALEQLPAPQVVAGYTDQLRFWEAQIGLVDLHSYVNDSTHGLSKMEQDDFYPLFWEQDFLEEKRLGIPVQHTAHFLVYNQTWGTELGFDIPPLTTESFRQQVCGANQFMRQDQIVQNDHTGGWLVSEETATLLGWLWAFGADLTAQNSEFRFHTTEAESAFEYLKELYDSNCAWLTQQPYPDEAFASRSALVAAASLIDLPYLVQAFSDAGNTDRWTALPFPSSIGSPVLPVSGFSVGIFPHSPEEQLAAWLFIRWITAPETQAFWVRMSGELPVRQSTEDLLRDYAATHSQWASVLGMIAFARAEPDLPSWGQVQWALHDAGTQLFRSYFTADRIPETLQELDRTAAELQDRMP